MKTLDIRYVFRLPDNREEIVDLRLDAETLDLIADVPEELPQWTRLNFYQCPNCPLTVESHSNCLIAINLVRLIGMFEHLHSYETVDVDIITPLRKFSKKTSAQKGVSSLMGLIMATSGCPHFYFFKPMARFHLPLADAEETVYRAASMYLLAQYFLQKGGQKPDLELEGLKKIYSDIKIVNESMVRRMLAASDKDVAINAIIILDIFAQTLFLVIEDSLDEVRYLFAPYFQLNEEKHKGRE